MAVTVRDTNGTPILPVVEHFGGVKNATNLAENPIGEGSTDGSGGGGGGGDGLEVRQRQEQQPATEFLDTSQRQQQQQQQQQLQPGRTFLDRPPPSECVEPVLPAGCTARRFSALGVCTLALVSGLELWTRSTIEVAHFRYKLFF